jgi:hypothetical protein
MLDDIGVFAEHVHNRVEEFIKQQPTKETGDPAKLVSCNG